MESSIFALELIFEHRNYFAIFGISLVIAENICLLYRSVAKKHLVVLCSIVIVFTLSFISFLRANTWSSPETLYASNLVHHPNSIRARLDYVNYLIEHHQWDTAHEQLSTLSKLKPQEPGFDIHKLHYYCAKNLPVAQQHIAKITQKTKAE